MRRPAILPATLVTLLTLGVAQSANATPITFGNVLSGESNAIPFGGHYQFVPGTNSYQQVYDGDVFGVGEVFISSISFFGTGNANGGNADGTFTMSLSTTSRDVNGLSTNMATNVGADSDVFFSGGLPAYPGAGLMTFVLATPFYFNPAHGNLLWDVQINGITVVTSGTTPLYVSQNGTFGSTSSRMIQGPFTGTAFFGLVTSFEATQAASPVPEPTTFVLFGSGLVMAVRRRRKTQ